MKIKLLLLAWMESSPMTMWYMEVWEQSMVGSRYIFAIRVTLIMMPRV